MMQKILVVEDDINACSAIDEFFSQRGYLTYTADTRSQAIATGIRTRPDFLITDWMLRDDGNGVDVAKALKKYNAALKIIFITAFPSKDLLEQLKNFPAVVIEKPLSLARLEQAVKSQAWQWGFTGLPR
jgi:DNA-binding response OmpR family regulator